LEAEQDVWPMAMVERSVRTLEGASNIKPEDQPWALENQLSGKTSSNVVDP
jgi:hypothetical protein